MDQRTYAQPTLVAPVPKAIPQGVFIDIDQKYYEPKEANETKDRHLRPHGTNVNLNSNGFVEQTTPIGLESGSLRVNFGSYIYQQQTGFDANHTQEERIMPTAVFF